MYFILFSPSALLLCLDDEERRHIASGKRLNLVSSTTPSGTSAGYGSEESSDNSVDSTDVQDITKQHDTLPHTSQQTQPHTSQQSCELSPLSSYYTLGPDKTGGGGTILSPVWFMVVRKSQFPTTSSHFTSRSQIGSAMASHFLTKNTSPHLHVRIKA